MVGTARSTLRQPFCWFQGSEPRRTVHGHFLTDAEGAAGASAGVRARLAGAPDAAARVGRAGLLRGLAEPAGAGWARWRGCSSPPPGQLWGAGAGPILPRAKARGAQEVVSPSV